MTRLGVIAVLTGLALLGGAGPAAAHNTLVSSDPADGASLASGPQRVTLVFDQPVNSGFNTVTVTGPGDTRWTAGQVVTNDNTVTTDMLPLGPAGEYTIGYRVVSADGHPVTGTLRFQLTQAGGGTPATAGQPAATEQQADGAPAWPWVLAALALLGAGVLLGLRVTRSRQP